MSIDYLYRTSWNVLLLITDMTALIDQILLSILLLLLLWLANRHLTWHHFGRSHFALLLLLLCATAIIACLDRLSRGCPRKLLLLLASVVMVATWLIPSIIRARRREINKLETSCASANHLLLTYFGVERWAVQSWGRGAAMQEHAIIEIIVLSGCASYEMLRLLGRLILV